MKRRRRAELEIPHTQGGLSPPRRLKGYANPQDSCPPLCQGSRVLEAWEEHFETAAQWQGLSGNGSFLLDSLSYRWADQAQRG